MLNVDHLPHLAANVDFNVFCKCQLFEPNT